MSSRKPVPKPPAPKPKFDTKDDDWETDPSYENNATEKSQRYGSASVPGSGRVDHVDFKSIHDKVKIFDQSVKEEFKEKNPTRGYGGKYGTEQVMDKAAQDFSYKAEITKHSSQTDGKKGFGGEHGIDERAKDQSAVGFDYKPTVEKHSSQKDHTASLGNQDVEKKEPSASSANTPPTLPVKPPATSAKPPATFAKPPAALPAKPPATPPAKTPPPIPPAKPSTTPLEKPSPTPPEKPSTTALARPPRPTPPAKPSTAVATPPKPSTESNVAEKSAASTTNTKADVGGIRARFENMKKQQEAETAQRVAEERKKRGVTDQKLQERQQSSNNTQEKIKQKEPAPTEEEPIRERSPERPKTPPTLGVVDENTSENVDNTNAETETPTTNLNENNDNNNTTTKTSDEPVYENVQPAASTKKEENKQESERFVGTVNVSAILRQRKTSSSSSKNEDDDEDWDVNKDEKSEKNNQSND